MKSETLTINEAIEQGYKFCTPEYDEVCLIDVKDCPFNRPYVLVGKETKPFRIPENLIEDLLDNWLCDQDIVEDENGKLNDLARKIDFTDVTDKLNAAFATNGNYYMPTSIKLIP